jgi:enterochelin esterase-like enzyme
MSLTGPVFLDGLIALSVTAFVGVVLLWPRLTRRTPWHVAGRAGSLALVNVLVLLTAGSQLNATYLFYSSWSDLHNSLSGGHLAQTSLDSGGAARQAADGAVAGAIAPVSQHLPALTRPVGSSGLLSYTVHGPLSGLIGTVVVQVPPGYTSPSNANVTYPVLEAFQGYPGSALAFPHDFDTQHVIGRAVASHQLRQPLLVSPQVEFPPGVDTEGVNGPPGSAQVDTWLTRDVPDWVGQHFRVEANRDAWATTGYSAGGWIAAMAAILHPSQYGAAIVMGGYFKPDFGPYVPFAPGSQLSDHYDLVRTITQQPPPIALWVQTSHADTLSYPSSMALLHHTRAPTAVHAVVLRNAGHRMGVWTAVFPEALTWLGQNVQGFHP